MSEREDGGGTGAAWRRRDWLILIAIAGWAALVIDQFPAPAPTPPAIPYAVAHLR